MTEYNKHWVKYLDEQCISRKVELITKITSDELRQLLKAGYNIVNSTKVEVKG